jgi:hypothetical protein
LHRIARTINAGSRAEVTRHNTKLIPGPSFFLPVMSPLFFGPAASFAMLPQSAPPPTAASHGAVESSQASSSSSASQRDVLDDPSQPQPGETEPRPALIYVDRDNWFEIPPEEEWLNRFRDPLKRLDDKLGPAGREATEPNVWVTLRPAIGRACFAAMALSRRAALRPRAAPGPGGCFVTAPR